MALQIHVHFLCCVKRFWWCVHESSLVQRETVECACVRADAVASRRYKPRVSSNVSKSSGASSSELGDI